MQRKILVKDLDFPLLNTLRGMSKFDFAKQKLLTGEPCLKVAGNTSNFIELHDDKYYIYVPSYDVLRGTLRVTGRVISFLFSETDKVERLTSNLYKAVDSNFYFIIKHKSILCIFHISTFLEVNDMIFTETDEHYALEFTSYSSRHRLVIDKKDLSFRKG